MFISVIEREHDHSPLEEAICEFRLAKDVKWDGTVPGLLYEKIKKEFPEREQRLVQEVRTSQEYGRFMEEIQTSEILVLYSKDRNILTQVGPGMVVLNVLKPYPGWEVSKQKILFVWESLLNILPISKLDSASLCYINTIELPSWEVKLEEYLHVYPYLGPNLPKEKQFMMDVVFKCDRDRCRLILSSSTLNQEKPTFRLDIWYFTYGLLAEDLSNWLEKAHEGIVNIFEGCITDKLREIFKRGWD